MREAHRLQLPYQMSQEFCNDTFKKKTSTRLDYTSLLRAVLNWELLLSFFTCPTLWHCRIVSSPPDTYRILVANILYADNYPSANRQPTDFSDAICPQKVFPSVGGEHTHNDYIESPTEKVVGNMLATEESVCVRQVFVYGWL